MSACCDGLGFLLVPGDEGETYVPCHRCNRPAYEKWAAGEYRGRNRAEADEPRRLETVT